MMDDECRSMASWDADCVILSPSYDTLSQTPSYKRVIFVRIDVDQAMDVSQECQVENIPCFQIWRLVVMDDR